MNVNVRHRDKKEISPDLYLTWAQLSLSEDQMKQH